MALVLELYLLTAELFYLKSVEKVKATSIKQSKTDKLVNIQNLK